MTAFIKKIQQNILQQKLVTRGDRVIVAVSGGADSVALLLVLMALRHELGLELYVAHFDHALRRGSARDRKFVAGLSKELGLPFITETRSGKIPGKGSVEEFARRVRYDFLLRAAKKAKAPVIAVAHSCDDLAETVLMRILRGSGLCGLQGMIPRRSVGGVSVIRPMLHVYRREIEDFLRERKASFIQDPTNRSLEFARNKLRLELIPYLQKHFTPDLKERLASLADVAGADYACLEEYARPVFDRIVTIRKGTVSIVIKDFLALPLALRRMVLRMTFSSLRKDMPAYDLRHIDLADRFICEGTFGRISLPEGAVLLRSKGARSAVIRNL